MKHCGVVARSRGRHGVRAVLAVMVAAMSLVAGSLTATAEAAAPTVSITASTTQSSTHGFSTSPAHQWITTGATLALTDTIIGDAQSVSWTTNAPGVATVTPTATGASVKGVVQGVAVITVTVTNDEGTSRDHITVTVADSHFAPITTATIPTAAPAYPDADNAVTAATGTIPAGAKTTLLAASRNYYLTQTTQTGTTQQAWIPTTAARIAASKITILSQTVYLFTGYRTTLTAVESPLQANTPITWKTANSSLVKVVGHGNTAVVTSLGTGQTTVTATAGSVTDAVRVKACGMCMNITANHAAHFATRAVAMSPHEIEISWPLLTAATSYRILAHKGGKWIVIRQDGSDVTLSRQRYYFTINGLAPGVLYKFRVEALKGKKIIKTATAKSVRTPQN